MQIWIIRNWRSCCFSAHSKNPEDYEAQFPKRDLKKSAGMVTRLAGAPGLFILQMYGAFVDERLAHQSGGTFYLRIEDTDDKRYVEGAVETIINSLAFFGINFDEGALLDGEKGDLRSVFPEQARRRDNRSSASPRSW